MKLDKNLKVISVLGSLFVACALLFQNCTAKNFSGSDSPRKQNSLEDSGGNYDGKIFEQYDFAHLCGDGSALISKITWSVGKFYLNRKACVNYNAIEIPADQIVEDASSRFVIYDNQTLTSSSPTSKAILSCRSYQDAAAIAAGDPASVLVVNQGANGYTVNAIAFEKVGTQFVAHDSGDQPLGSGTPATNFQAGDGITRLEIYSRNEPALPYGNAKMSLTIDGFNFMNYTTCVNQ